jgi:hypothetical protein
MTDKEILEFAAKAAGIKIHKHIESNTFWIDGPRVWDPLTDDGDALRLAVKLGIDIAQAQVDYYDKNSTDPYRATRCSIVRAAAEIWKAMS